VKKIKLTTNTAEGNEGDIVNLDDTTADIYIREGMGEEVSEESLRKSTEETEPSEGEGPIWSERVVMKQNKRNITVELWPPSDEHPEWGPNLRLVESYNNDGNWETQSIRLTRGPKTLFLSELIKEGWKKLREFS